MPTRAPVTQRHTNTLTHSHPRSTVPYPVAPLPGHQVSAGHKSQAQALFLPSAVPQHQVRVPTVAPKNSLWYRNTFPRFWLRNWKETPRGKSQGWEGKAWSSGLVPEVAPPWYLPLSSPVLLLHLFSPPCHTQILRFLPLIDGFMKVSPDIKLRTYSWARRSGSSSSGPARAPRGSSPSLSGMAHHTSLLRLMKPQDS